MTFDSPSHCFLLLAAARRDFAPSDRFRPLLIASDCFRSLPIASDRFRLLRIAQWIDETSRLFIPGSFLICLFFLFGCEFYDDYGDFDLPTPAPMFEVGRDGIGLLRIASECFGVLQGASGCFGVLWSVSGCLGLLRIAHVRGGPRFLLICPPFSSTARRLSPR